MVQVSYFFKPITMWDDFDANAMWARCILLFQCRCIKDYQ